MWWFRMIGKRVGKGEIKRPGERCRILEDYVFGKLVKIAIRLRD